MAGFLAPSESQLNKLLVLFFNLDVAKTDYPERERCSSILFLSDQINVKCHIKGMENIQEETEKGTPTIANTLFMLMVLTPIRFGFRVAPLFQ